MKSEKIIVGWREWLHFPDLGIRWVKAKIDTGARTSALHASDMELFKRGRRQMVGFVVYPVQRSKDRPVRVECEVMEMRSIRSSNGSTEERPVIETSIDVGGEIWSIDVSLTRRDEMGFRMLLGRQALSKRRLIDPGQSFLTRRKKRKSKAK